MSDEFKRLGRFASLVTERAGSADFKLALEHVEGWTGRLTTDTEAIGSGSEELGGEGIRFRSGDVVFGKLRPYLAKAWVADRAGAAVGDFHVYRPARDVHPRFLLYSLLRREYIDEVNASTYGSKMPRASWEHIKGTTHHVPGFAEQRRIAEFLDRETAQIDELIAKQEQLISTLSERERARVDAAVRGQDVQRASRVDTYDPWFPEIPVGWSLTSLVRVTLERVDFRGATPTKTDEGTQLVTARNIRPGHIDYEISREYIDPDTYDSVMRRGKPSVGDVLLTMEAPLGNVALVDREDVAFAQRVVMFRLDRQKLEPAFAVHALNADRFHAQLLSLATGSTALGLKASKLIELKLPLPPIEFQTEIARDLDEHSRVSEKLRLRCSKMIATLRERRQALISAAVTGQIDVGGAS